MYLYFSSTYILMLGLAGVGAQARELVKSVEIHRATQIV